MIIIHDVDDRILPRFVKRALHERLRTMPAVVLTGARQTGKSTLVQGFGPERRRYRTLDDLDVVDLARRDPDALVGGDGAVTLDEVQREPGLLHAVKRAIDKRRTAGRFLLSGSANLSLMRQVSESLAGRASYVTLWPMTRREQLGLGCAGRWEDLLAARDEEWMDVIRSDTAESEDWRALAKRGGYPTPAVHMDSARDRTVWFDGYVRTYLERDLQDLASISTLPDFRRLMRAACLRLGQLLNQTELGRDVGLPQSTTHRYLNLLETSYLLLRLPVYAVNRTKRLIKSPKLYWGDTGIAMHLAELDEPTGGHLENMVLTDLLAWRDSRIERAEVFYWRTTNGEEVDLVIESAGRLLPIEIKATARPRVSDAEMLRRFRVEYGEQSRAGLLLHTGDTVEWLTPDVLAAPWWKVI
jgi:predicted AAA+ superfamily ATPase